MTGPSLIGCTQKHSIDWLLRFTKNSSGVLAEGDDIYARELYAAYGNAVMTPFPNLSDSEILAIYKYIDEFSAK
jgi:hypothetical protein